MEDGWRADGRRIEDWWNGHINVGGYLEGWWISAGVLVDGGWGWLEGGWKVVGRWLEGEYRVQAYEEVV